MNPYMAYSAGAGSSEGAVLVFANSVREAKTLAWKHSYLPEYCDDDFTDLRARRLNPKAHIMKQMIKEEPHVIESPESCNNCLMWGNDLNEDGLCEDCQADMEVEYGA